MAESVEWLRAYLLRLEVKGDKEEILEMEVLLPLSIHYLPKPPHSSILVGMGEMVVRGEARALWEALQEGILEPSVFRTEVLGKEVTEELAVFRV
jgi:hypothetical protein